MSENILSLAPQMEVITSIITQELELGRKRSFVWVVREKKRQIKETRIRICKSRKTSSVSGRG